MNSVAMVVRHLRAFAHTVARVELGFGVITGFADVADIQREAVADVMRVT